MRLQGNKIIVTGATSGIGEALAKKFVELDNQVIAIGRNSEKLKILSNLINGLFRFAVTYQKLKI
jgi:uncharacterized oxidoreductase